MTIRLIRVFFLVLSAVCGYYLGQLFTNLSQEGAIIGAIIGLVGATVLILIESRLERVSLSNLSASAFGLLFGFFMAWMVTLILRLLPLNEILYSSLQIVFTLVFCYLGMVIAVKGKDEFNLVIPYVRFSRQDLRDQLFILDTSVIIDGRIAGICETGFIEGKIVIPRFILQELHQIADSADDAKRNRGRRGLDMLEKIKSIKGMEVIIHDEGLSDIKEVDAKLVRLAKMLNCSVVTNDFNLNKVATVEGVKIHNINDLANALRPVVFPGEQMNVHIKREGKERNQGVAFMEDGTMLVVDNGRKLIGKNAKVSVTSVLQTSAGKMIFANLVEDNNNGKKPQDSQQQK
ncbi:MAG: PIN domain nuclease [Candidatus Aadella gelida]|nr:PIN domain nuclease [Candidatus Aadella gelida]